MVLQIVLVKYGVVLGECECSHLLQLISHIAPDLHRTIYCQVVDSFLALENVFVEGGRASTSEQGLTFRPETPMRSPALSRDCPLSLPSGKFSLGSAERIPATIRALACSCS